MTTSILKNQTLQVMNRKIFHFSFLVFHLKKFLIFFFHFSFFIFHFPKTSYGKNHTEATK